MGKVSITKQMYADIFDTIYGKIDERDIAHSMGIEIELQDGDTHIMAYLSFTLLIFRTPYVVYPISGPEGGEIRDIIPIWWDFEVYDYDSGDPLDNDFSFDEIRNMFYEYNS